jgi:hydroxymethylpyrimidine pyrophosphatase-like HAD family hydrolase
MKTIVVDFDGTIVTYDGWKGQYIYGEIIPEARETLKQIKKNGFRIMIHTCRNWVEQQTIEDYLSINDIPYDLVICGKPFGLFYIDDKSCGKNANWEDVKKTLKLKQR